MQTTASNGRWPSPAGGAPRRHEAGGEQARARDMQRAGFVERLADPEGPRRTRLGLTGEGRAVFERAVARSEASEDELRGRLTGGDVAALRRALLAFVERRPRARARASRAPGLVAATRRPRAARSARTCASPCRRGGTATFP